VSFHPDVFHAFPCHKGIPGSVLPQGLKAISVKFYDVILCNEKVKCLIQ